MAAQFQDEKLPLKHSADLGLRIENGNYNVRINQLFNPDNFDLDDSDRVHFEIVIEKALNGEVRANIFEGIPWLK